MIRNKQLYLDVSLLTKFYNNNKNTIILHSNYNMLAINHLTITDDVTFFISSYIQKWTSINTHTHTQPFNGPFPGLPGGAGTKKVKPIWILLKQETVSG